MDKNFNFIIQSILCITSCKSRSFFCHLEVLCQVLYKIMDKLYFFIGESGILVDLSRIVYFMGNP